MTEEQGSAGTIGLLSSWKEIAAYLGVNVRTAQKWEVERGLPVRRLPGGRGRVVAMVSDLEAWLPAPGAVTGEPVVEKRRSFRWVAVLVGVLVVMAGVGWASWVSWRGAPSTWHVVGDALVVVDDHERELWRKTFGFPLTDYQLFADRGQTMGWVGDVDGDGDPEVIFAAYSKTSETTPTVYCYSRRGAERWRFVPGTSAASFPKDYHPPYYPENLLVFRAGGAVRIAVASVHHTWFPCQIALLSGDGQLLREYWHAGHIQTLAVSDTKSTGRPLLYAGGIANGYKQATLVVLNPETFSGSSREEDVTFQLPGAPGLEEARVLFPRSCINRAKETFNGVTRLDARAGRLYVGVYEEAGAEAQVLHTFDQRMTYQGAGLSSRFAARHAELQNTRLLDHALEPDKETQALTHLRWLTQGGTVVAHGHMARSD